MTSGRGGRPDALFARAGLFVVVSTLALTVAVLGLVALASGGLSGVVDRLPFYVLALAFVGTIVALVGDRVEARAVLEAALVATGLAYWGVTNWDGSGGPWSGL